MYSISLGNVATSSLSDFMESRRENNGLAGHTPSFQMLERSTGSIESDLGSTQETSAKKNSESSNYEHLPTQLSDYAKAEELYSQLQQQAWLDQLKS